MVSCSPPGKPQATFTEVATSIIAASLPICHTPKDSPRSLFRSTVFMLLSVLLVGRKIIPALALCARQWNLPCPGVYRTDGDAGDIGFLQRFDIEIKALDGG